MNVVLSSANSTRIADTHIARWLGLIRTEYLESPGLHLTLAQARRFWGLDDLTSAALFAALVEVKFLKQTRTGEYLRADVT